MIEHTTIMIYVDNMEESIDFWKNFFDFSETQRLSLTDTDETILLTQPGGGVDLQFFTKDFIRHNSPEVSLETPSLIFDVKEFDQLYQTLKNNAYFVGDIIQHGDAPMFNFADNEQRYFVVKKAYSY